MPDIYNFDFDDSPGKIEKTEKSPQMKVGKNTAAAENQRIEKAKADIISADNNYLKYLKTISEYKKNTAAEADTAKKLEAAKKGLFDYTAAWDNAASNAKKAWEKDNGEIFKEKLDRKSEAAKAAQKEKDDRLGKITERENNINQTFADCRKLAGDVETLRIKYKKELEDAQKYVPPGCKCDENVRSRLSWAEKHGYLSFAQKSLKKQDAEMFCSGHAQDAAELMKLEKSLPGTQFYNALSNFELQETDFGRFGWRLTWKAAIVFAVFALLTYFFNNAVVNILGIIMCFFANVTMGSFITLCILKIFFAKKKKRVTFNTIWGTISLILGIIQGVFMTAEVLDMSKDMLVFGLIIAAAGALFFRIIVNIPFVRRILAKQDFIVGKAYRRLFNEADIMEADSQIRDGEARGSVDAMIVGVLRHDELVEYLCAEERRKRIEKINASIEQTDAQDKKIKEIEDQANEKRRALEQDKQLVMFENKRTDTRLLRQLEELDRRYDVGDMPDFTIRKNILPDDLRVLYRMEKEIGIMRPVPNRKEAISQYRSTYADLGAEAKKLKAAVEKNVSDINSWMNSAEAVSLESADGTYKYTVPETICISNIVKKKDNPFIFDFSGKPVLITYSAEKVSRSELIWEAESLFIRMFWKAFVKAAPPELLKLAVVDLSGSIEYKIDGFNMIPEFNRSLYIGYDDTAAAGLKERKIRYPVYEIFETRELKALNDSLKGQIRECTAYRNTNPDDMDSAAKATGNANGFIQVNYAKANSTVHNPNPYYIVFFIVPERSETGRSSSAFLDSMQDMRRLINGNDTWKNGFLPVMIAQEGSIDEHWASLVRRVSETGRTFKLDITELKFI